MSSQYEIKISGSAPTLFPTDTLYGLVWYGEEEPLEIPKRYPYQGEWGGVLSNLILLREKYPMPDKLDILWLSIVEKRFYTISEKFPKPIFEDCWSKFVTKDNGFGFSHIVIGMAPYGGIAVWFNGYKKAIIMLWTKAKGINIPMAEFMPNNPTITLNELCNYYVNSDPRVRENLEKNGLPPRDLFDNYMKQFTYRYQVAFERWDEQKGEWKAYDEEEQDKMPELDYIEEALYDGTHDKLHDGGLMKYHEAGKPKKLAVQWHVKKSEWSAYFWFEDAAIRAIFDRFYGTHPDTKTDFILRIDPYSNRYELAMYRYGLREPNVISTSSYQLLVFKNKFECFRSKNYAQERGAWIW